MTELLTERTTRPVITDHSPGWAGMAEGSGLVVLARAAWPESDEDTEVPPVAGFIVSTFSPLVAVVADRCMQRHTADIEVAVDPAPEPTAEPVTAVVIASALGDVTSAVHVAEAIDGGKRVGPLLFFQSVPNAVAGYVAARWSLTGPVVCLATPESALEIAALLIADGDADRALLIHAELSRDEAEPDRATALLLAEAPDEADSTGGQG
jgi:hypothetical protein